MQAIPNIATYFDLAAVNDHRWLYCLYHHQTTHKIIIEMKSQKKHPLLKQTIKRYNQKVKLAHKIRNAPIPKKDKVDLLDQPCIGSVKNLSSYKK